MVMHSSRYVMALASTAAVAIASLSSTPARAGEQPATASADGINIEDIVVTARRRDERLQDVPVAITAIQSDTLRTQNITSTADLTRLTPGLVVTPTNRGSVPGYSIRGQRGNSTVNLLVDSAVAVYIDELGSSRPTGSNQAFFDIASVQVLKGPQGTLFGRNTTGGAILILPKRPTQEFEGYVQGALGNFALRDFEGALNLPLGDTLALRIGGKVTRRDGYMHNVLTGEDANDANAQSYRAQLLWTPGSAIRSNTTLQYFRARQAGDGPKLFAYNPNGVPAIGPARATLQNLLAQEFALAATLGKYEYRSLMPRRDDADVLSIHNNSSFELGDHGGLGSITLKNIIGYRHSKGSYTVDFDGSAVRGVEFPGFQRANSFSEEFQIQGDAGTFRYTLGSYYFKETGRDYLRNVQFADLATLAPASFPALSIQDYDAKNTSYAAFAHFEYDLTDQLTLAAGARITRDKRFVNYHNITASGVTPTAYRCSLTGVNQTNENRDSCNFRTSKTFTEPTWDIALNYKISRDLMVYIANHRGYRSGGFNGAPVVGAPVVAFKPEIVTEFEAGLKADQRVGDVPVRLDLAVYRQKFDNVQRSVTRADTSVTPTRIINQIVNAAKATISGVEVASTVKLTPAFEVNFTYSYVHAKYDNWQDSYLVAGVPTLVSVADSKFIQVPAQQVSGSVRYTLPLPETAGKLSASVSYYYQSRMALNDINTSNCGPDGLYPGCRNRNAFEPGYGLLNARLDWRNVAGKGFDLAVYGNNLANTYYRTGGSYIVSTVGPGSAYIGAPRMYGVELRIPFGAYAY